MTPDELLAEWLRRDLRADEGARIAALPDIREHLRACPQMVVVDATGSNGTYGCDTGCDYMTLTAEVSCPHHPGPFDVTYGTFGELDQMVEELADLEDALAREAQQAETGAAFAQRAHVTERATG
jgi:hypothetical protein